MATAFQRAVAGQPPRDLLQEQYDELMRQQNEARKQAEGAMQPADTSSLADFARRRQQEGSQQLMLALAAQEAGKDFAPMQAHFLRQAGNANEPQKMGGGVVSGGEFVQDPSHLQGLKIQQAESKLKHIDQLLQGNLGAQQRAQLQQQAEQARREAQQATLAVQQAIAAQGSADRRYAADLAHQDRQAALGQKTDKATETARANAASGREVLGLLKEAEKYLPKATSSYGGYGIDQAARVFGASTEGSQATASLRTIAGQIVSKMPRMEGPQSNYDVELYRQMAGKLEDPTVPLGDKQAALATLRDLNLKYANTGGTGTGGATGSFDAPAAQQLPQGWSVKSR